MAPAKGYGWQLSLREGWRCRWESHPRMGVLQTPALLLGYGTLRKTQDTRNKIQRRTNFDVSDMPALISYYSSTTGSVNVNPSRIASPCHSAASSIATGVVAVIV